MNRLFFLFLLLISVSFSAVSDYSMQMELNDVGITSVQSEINFADSADKTVSFCFSGEVSNIELRDKSGLSLESQTSSVEDYNCISFVVPYDYAKISFESYDFTSKNGSLWDFEMKMYSSENIDLFSANLILPPYSLLQKTNGAVSSRSSVLEVLWDAENVSASNKFNLSAGYELTPAEDYTGWFILVIIIVVVLAASHVLYRRRPKPEEKPEAKAGKPKGEKEDWLELNEVFKTLDEIDKEIVKEIAKQKGKTTQAKIYLNTHIPKATLSRRLNSLENREIIRKSQKGNRNLISLNLEKK